MRKQFSPELEQHLAFHRGIGHENTIDALQAGVDENPYLQEFDVQRFTRAQNFIGRVIGNSSPTFDYSEVLMLGHPPNTNLNESLAHAMKLFEDRTVLPKIDVKPLRWQVNHHKTIDMLLSTLESFAQPSLLNISGSPRRLPFMAPTPATYLELERYVSRHAPEHVLINLDLARFGDLSDEYIAHHIDTLRAESDTRVHSFSPLIDDEEGVERSIKLARQHTISDIHFWGIQSHKYAEGELVALAARVVDEGLHPVIDIALDSIIPLDDDETIA